MKRFPFFVAFLVPMLANAALLGTARTWEFMQSVGGVGLGKPVFESETWRLPLLCDVSGLKSFTAKPTMLNSGLILADTKTSILDHDIIISIETGIAGLAGKSSACDAVNVGNIKSGKYRVMYRDPDGRNYLVGDVVFSL